VRVDCHTHLFPERLFAAIRRWFCGVGWQIPYPHATEEVLGLLRGWGVEQVWALTYAHRPGVAEGINAWLGELVRAEPMVRGFFSVHPADDEPRVIAERALERHRLQGLKLHAEVQDLAVDDRRLDGVFDLLEERRVPCLLHTGDAPYPEPRENLDVARVVERMRRNPHLVAVIAHLGAYQTDRYLDLLDHHGGLHLEVSFTLFPGSPVPQRLDLERLARHRSRLLFGSDFPNLTFGYADQADAWWDLPWVRQDAEQFFGGRARSLLAGS
jgi:predicted TIM-barrel fold metal-dependent hydrolase